MRWKHLTIAGLMAQCATVALAETPDQPVAIGPVPDWVEPSEPLAVPDDAQGLLFYRAEDTVVRLTADGQRTYSGLIMRILQPQALQAGNIAIAWNPAAGNPVVHSLKIRRGSREIDVLESTAFEILRREDQLEQAMLDGMLTATLRVPDLRVGDDLEIAYTLPAHDPTLRETSHGLLFLADSPPPGRFRLELSWDEGQEPKTLLAPSIGNAAERSEDTITLRFDNPEALSLPREAPPRYAWTRVLEYSDFQDWTEVSSRFYSMFDEASTLSSNSKLREEAEIIAESYATDLERTQAALKLVQQQVRYIYIGLNGGNFRPATADETWERRYGDCKGKTAMLLALLKEMGIEAEAVLVNNNVSVDGLETKLANPGLFDHILVRATIDGEQYWLDGTLPAVIEGRPEPFISYEWVLPLSRAGNNIESIEQSPYELPQAMGIYEMDASAGFDQPAQTKYTSISRGLTGLSEYLGFSAVSASQLEADLRNRLEGSNQWDTVDSVEYRYDRGTQASILTISGTGPVDWDREEDGSYSLILNGGGFSKPTRRQRPSGSEAPAPFYNGYDYSCYVTMVRVPDDTPLRNWLLSSAYDLELFGRIYYRSIEKRSDRTIRMISGTRVERAEITAAEAAKDNPRLERFDDSKAWINYNPYRSAASMGDLRTVRPVTEVDWTGTDLPCLPADVLDED